MPPTPTLHTPELSFTIAYNRTVSKPIMETFSSFNTTNTSVNKKITPYAIPNYDPTLGTPF